MPRSIPQLTSLRAFEAAGRLQSFKAAAEELNVTPAAISHQVKALEDVLGTLLFHRITRSLALTDTGRAALPLVSEGFGKLAEAMDLLGSKQPLSVSVSPSFGSIWLVPRLDRFYARHPEIELRIDGTDRVVDIARGEADLAIRYGAGGYPGVQVDQLFQQHNLPVCSPDLANGTPGLKTPADLSNHTLLHVEWKEAEASWRMWLRAAGLSQVEPTRGPRFTQEAMALQAAIDGQGVALLGDRLVSDHLASGQLIRPFDQALTTKLRFSYHLVSRRKTSAEVDAFRKWMIEEIDKYKRQPD